MRIHATDAYGNGLTPITIQQFEERSAGGRDYSRSFIGSEAKDIPYGDYFAIVKAGDLTLNASIHVDQPSVFVVASGTGWFIHLGPNAKPGPLNRVVGLPQNLQSPVWVRIVPLFNNDRFYITKLVGTDGTFSVLGGLDPGEYLVVVLDAQRKLASAEITYNNSSGFEINVSTGMVRQLSDGQ